MQESRVRAQNDGVWRMLDFFTKIRRLLQGVAVRALVYLMRFPLIRRFASFGEPYLFGRVLKLTTTAGSAGGAIGYLFRNHDPHLSAKDIYRQVFSADRLEQGYQSQMGQDMFLNRWFFKNHGPGFFIDVGAFDGIMGSNTAFFEKNLNWQGIAFEPNPAAFQVLQRTRACRLIRGCAYYRDGEVPFLALSEQTRPEITKMPPPRSMLSMVFDSTHGGSMLSGIPDHMDQLQWIQWLSKPMKLNQEMETVGCHRIATVLNESDVKVVDYLSIDVEGAELEVLRGIDFDAVQVNVIGVEHTHTFPEVYELLTTSGFDYQGLLFFDEIFVHKCPRYSWDA